MKIEGLATFLPLGTGFGLIALVLLAL